MLILLPRSFENNTVQVVNSEWKRCCYFKSLIGFAKNRKVAFLMQNLTVVSRKKFQYVRRELFFYSFRCRRSGLPIDIPLFLILMSISVRAGRFLKKILELSRNECNCVNNKKYLNIFSSYEVYQPLH